MNRFIFDILSGRNSIEALHQLPEFLEAVSLVKEQPNIVLLLKDKPDDTTKWINYPNKLIEKIESEVSRHKQ